MIIKALEYLKQNAIKRKLKEDLCNSFSHQIFHLKLMYLKLYFVFDKS